MPEYNAENTDFPIGVTLVNIAKGTLSSSPHRLMSEQSTIRYSFFNLLGRTAIPFIAQSAIKHFHANMKERLTFRGMHKELGTWSCLRSWISRIE